MQYQQRKPYSNSDSNSEDDGYSSSEYSSSSYDSDSDSFDSGKDSSLDDDYQTTSALSPSSPSYQHHPAQYNSSTTMRQRRRGQQPPYSPHQQRDNRIDIEKQYGSPKRRKRRKGSNKTMRYLLKIYYCWCRASSYFLMLALFLWILVQVYGMLVVSSKAYPRERKVSGKSPARNKRLELTEYWRHHHQGVWEDEKDKNNVASWFGFANKKERIKKRDKEAIPDGCELQRWQQIGHPNCMELHQLDLSLLLRDAFHSADGDNSTVVFPSGKYLSSGMWRDVFRLSSAVAGYQNEHVVLKMMKSEHEVDNRNLERHKREAIVMDVLTRSPHIVNLFVYCGNSVLTEYLPLDLEAYLRPKKRSKPRPKLRRGKSLMHEPTPDDEAPRVTTPEERLDLAFQTVQALEDLHQNDIIHADLQSKQFLVDLGGGDDNTSSNVTIKLNDFNRCRFLPRKIQNDTARTNNSLSSPLFSNSTVEPPPICPIVIPTAPGMARSPEEYDMLPLTTQLDIYSLANVWYQILTGNTPWAEQANTNVVKNLIMHGQKPPLTENQTRSTSDSVLANLLYAAYEVDPNQRATARDLKEGLQALQ